MRIGNYIIDKNSPIFIIAEISANHNGSIEVAKNTIRAAKEAGADAVKFQTWKTELLMTKSARLANSPSSISGSNISTLSSDAS